MRFVGLLLPLLLSSLAFGAEARAVVPASGPAPAGPYSPGISVGDYVYVAGQGAHAADGSLPDNFPGQVRQKQRSIT